MNRGKLPAASIILMAAVLTGCSAGGHVGLSKEELTDILGNGDVEVIIE